jgi:chromosomal replication initiator protein
LESIEWDKESESVQPGAQIWQRTLAELQQMMTKQNYNAWLQHTRCVGMEGSILTVGVPSTFHAEYLEKRVPHMIGSALRVLGFDKLELRYAVLADEKTDSPVRAKSVQRNGNGSATTMASHDHLSDEPPGGKSSSPLNPQYVFETFVQGSGNRFAYAACVSVADNPAKRFNPLFIYGPVGLGKTHLLHAIGHQAKREHQHLAVLYTTSETFVNEMIGAIQKSRTEEFRNKYREVDILLIDDIQFIAGKEGTQEEFFHTFNSLHQSQKQIVMSSDRHPKAMTTLEDRLRSRFEWGLIADVQPPDLEHRIAILQAKAELQSVPVPRNVLEYIARHVQSNVRELEGTLQRVTYTATVQNKPVTLELAAAALDPMNAGAKRNQPTLDQVLDAVLRYYRVDRKDMLGPSRERVISLPRQVVMYLLREETSCSTPRIGEYLGGRDHSTIIHGIEKITEEIRNENLQIRKDIAAIRNILYEANER